VWPERSARKLPASSFRSFHLIFRALARNRPAGTGLAAHWVVNDTPELVSSSLTVARYLDSLKLIPLLDELRDAYDIAKQAGHADLQSRLMHARRTLAAALDQTLNLHSELAEFQEHLEHARGSVTRRSEPGPVLAKASEPNARKIS
jgi:hypothetical protein